jgi:hypothetical protein
VRIVSTAFSLIAAAFVAALQTAPAVSAKVYRQRERPITSDDVTAVNVQFDGAVPTPGAIAGAPVDWRTRIMVECYARSASASGDVAVDELLKQVYARLAADSTLGGMVANIGEPMIEADCDALGQKTGMVRLTYVVEHRTSNFSLEQA